MSFKPRLLDLFSGAGGAARGYQLAGFHVTGVDIEPQPRYAGDEFVQADAMTFPLEGFDVIHASPPCQAFTAAKVMRPDNVHPDLLGPTRERLLGQLTPWVIENVPGAPMRSDLVLCGTQFRLQHNGFELRRHRLFETSWQGFSLMAPCQHQKPAAPVFGHNPNQDFYVRHGRGFSAVEKAAIMGIDWMTRDELAQAIPPAYSLFIGEQLLRSLEGVA